MTLFQKLSDLISDPNLVYILMMLEFYGLIFELSNPGLILFIPIVDRMVKVSLRVVAMEVPSQDVITRDNVSIKISAVIYFRVIDASKAIVEVENYLSATLQLSQTTPRSMLGKSELDELVFRKGENK